MRSSHRFLLSLSMLVLIANSGSHLLLGQAPDAQSTSPEAEKAAKAKYEEDGEGKEADFIRKRMQWFHDQRAYPHKTLPAGIRQRAAAERDRSVAMEAQVRRSLAASGSARASATVEPAWHMIGSQPSSSYYYGVDSGRVTSMAINPANPKIIYVGAAEGGVWKSIDGGATWKPLTDSQVSLAVGSIALDPSNLNTIYVGTGEGNFSGDSYYGAGILKSTDAGATWTQYGGPFLGGSSGGTWIGAIAVHPSNNQILLVAVQTSSYGTEGLYRSTDGGKTWTGVYNPTNVWAPGTAVFFDHTNGNLAYAATDGGGILKSIDAGKTWNPANGSGNNALPTPNVGRIALAMAPSNTSILYAAIANSSSGDLLGLYKSVDAGGNWAPLSNTPNFCATQCWYDITIAVSPINPNFVVAGGVFPYHPGGSAVTTSLDGGVTWVDQSTSLHPDTHALAFTPDGATLYVGNDGGVWKTTNPTANQIAWQDLNNTLAITEFYPGLSMDPNNVSHSFIGAQDNGTQKYTGSLSWPNVTCGDGGATIIDYAASSTIYSNCIQLSLEKSIDDGANWSDATNGLNSSDRTAWVPPVSIDPERHNTLYFGTYRVYQTTNAAGLWTPISGDLTGPSGQGNLNTIAVAPTDSNTIFTGSTDSKIYVTRNALSTTTVTWTEVTSAKLPGRNVTWIAVDPTSAVTAYAGYSGFTGFGDTLGHIFKTANAGSTWTDVSGNLPNTPVNAIVVDPDAPETIFIGTDIGAFYTTNDGTSWSTLGTGLPNVVVTGLGLHENSRTLRASTHGRSVWDLNIASLIPIPTVLTVSPNTVNADGPAVTLTVTGSQFKTTSVVAWNGSALSTTYGNAGSLTATVPATDLLKGGAVSVGVINGTGGKLSNVVTVTVVNPKPTLTALSKSSAPAGSASFLLTVTGTNFVSTSKITWKGAAITTTYISKTSLSATIPVSYLTTAAAVPVTVVSPTPGGGASSALTFTISNPLPVLGTVSPTSATAGGASFVLTVAGSNFATGAKILWNGAALTTTLVNSTKLTAAIPTAAIAKAGTASVKVLNPAPGGGTSTAALTFTILNPAPKVTALSPASATAGAASFPLTVTGANFVSTSLVKWNGTALATTFSSATKLTAVVPAADIAKANTASITVSSPAPGGGTTTTLQFSVK